MCKIHTYNYSCYHSHTVRHSQCNAMLTYMAPAISLHEPETPTLRCRGGLNSTVNFKIAHPCGPCSYKNPEADLKDDLEEAHVSYGPGDPRRGQAVEDFIRGMCELDDMFPKLMRGWRQVGGPVKSYAQLQKVRRKESLLSREMSNEPKKLDYSAATWAADIENIKAEAAEDEGFQPAELKPKKGKGGVVFVSEDFERETSEGWGVDSDEDASGCGGSSADSHSSDSELSSCKYESESLEEECESCEEECDSYEEESSDGDTTETTTPPSSPQLEASDPVKGGKCVLEIDECFEVLRRRSVLNDDIHMQGEMKALGVLRRRSTLSDGVHEYERNEAGSQPQGKPQSCKLFMVSWRQVRTAVHEHLAH